MRSIRAIAVALLLAYPAQAAELPDLGDAARLSFSSAQEAKLGREIMRQIRADRDYLDDPELTEYLNALGDRLAAASEDPSRHFEFFVVRDPTINAFALPGGFIGVHTGLFSATRNESELAGVLAHEIAHVTQNHIARIVSVQGNSTLTTLAALAVAILAARSNSQVSQAAIATAQAYSVQSQLDYTREHEREADRVGFQTLSRSGLDASGMVTFFERLQTQTRLYENNAPSYLRTHPLNYERIADMQNRLQGTAYHQVADSLEYRLLRAKIQAQQGEADDAVKRFAGQGYQDETDEAVRRYGLAAALLRANQAERAAAELQGIPRKIGQTPIVLNLTAEVAFARGRGAEAVALLKNGLAAYPDSRAMAYAYARGLLRQGQARPALDLLRQQLFLHPDDPRLFELQAQAYQAMKREMESHMALAEAYVRREEHRAAIEQLQLALKSGDRDFYRLSIAEARLRQLQALVQRQEATR
ncbi:MAG: M48 family metallopeptidase [Hydrogenophilaceae bacterium]|nr:M48 family metallopeptidase [Hydrogenophilaceae bacterium]